MDCLALGKMDIALPFAMVVAVAVGWPFWCTSFAGMLTER